MHSFPSSNVFFFLQNVLQNWSENSVEKKGKEEMSKVQYVYIFAYCPNNAPINVKSQVGGGGQTQANLIFS